MSARKATAVRYVCPVCEKTFNSRQARNQHKNLQHEALLHGDAAAMRERRAFLENELRAHRAELEMIRGHLDRQLYAVGYDPL